MDLGMFDKICPSLKTRALIDERRFGMSRSDKNSERYVIPTMILVRSTRKAGDQLIERED
jgi:hypothetical protein